MKYSFLRFIHYLFIEVEKIDLNISQYYNIY
jgi:hypothetical protein